MDETRELQRRVSLLEKAINLADTVLKSVPERREVNRVLWHRCGYFVSICSRTVTKCRGGDDETINTSVVMANAWGDDGPFGRQQFAANFTKLEIAVTTLGLQMPPSCNLETEMIGDEMLIKERAWRPCMQGFKEWLVSELENVRGEATEGSSEFVFKKTTNTWRIHFNGTEMEGVQDGKSLRDIHFLLSRPNEFVSIFDLPDNKGTDVAMSSIAVATIADRDLFRQQHNELRGDIDRLKTKGAPEPEIQEAEEQLETLKSQLNQNFDNRGQPRQLSGALEKAVGRTQKRFNRKLDEWAKIDELRGLAAFLEKSVTIDTDCKYAQPPQFPSWET